MEFSPQQEAALVKVKAWLADPDSQVFKMFGFAGTGKSTLAKHMNADYYAAYTGKAAHVLQQKGCSNASTIHRLIYNPREKSMARLRQLQQKLEHPNTSEHEQAKLREHIAEERANLQKPSFTLNLDSPLRRARLLVIDECSMVNEQIGRDLLSFGCKILVLGDPAQLPPVYGGGFFTRGKPDVLLTEVHRHARDNPILDLVTRIRTGGSWRQHELTAAKVEPEEAMQYEQIIVGRNATRHIINARCRELLGMPAGVPVAGDKLVCLRNNHELGLMNGALYDVESCDPGEAPDYVLLGLTGYPSLAAHTAPFTGGSIDPWMEREYEMFDYGYALTCHKSQGSQWDSVLVFDESRCFSDARRWLYTACTRASRTLKVVL